MQHFIILCKLGSNFHTKFWWGKCKQVLWCTSHTLVKKNIQFTALWLNETCNFLWESSWTATKYSVAAAPIPLIELSFKKECKVEDKSMPLFLPNRIIVMHVMHFQFLSYWSSHTLGLLCSTAAYTQLSKSFTYITIDPRAIHREDCHWEIHVIL